jgi:sarcosine oxidase
MAAAAMGLDRRKPVSEVRGCDIAVIGLGAIGSAAAWQAARDGLRVVGFEQFELGHERGASHDSSRILRHSYHTPTYVRLTFEAYDAWEQLEAETGETFVTVTGGLDLFPADAVIDIDTYTASLAACGVAHDVLDVAAVRARWPQFRLPPGTRALHQERTAIVPAARGTAAMQRRARDLGAMLLDHTRVEAIGADGVVRTSAGTWRADRVIVAADAWTAGLLAPILGRDLPLTVTEEQVTYFEVRDPAAYAPGTFPVWIWMDEPAYYGFPTYGEATIKAAYDCGGPPVTAEVRSGREDPSLRDGLLEFMAQTFTGVVGVQRSKRCLYTLPPDRDFVVSRVPGAPAVTVGLGAAHGFKFAPAFGRWLVDCAISGREAAPEFALDRPGLTDPDYAPTWFV